MFQIYSNCTNNNKGENIHKVQINNLDGPTNNNKQMLSINTFNIHWKNERKVLINIFKVSSKYRKINISRLNSRDDLSISFKSEGQF